MYGAGFYISFLYRVQFFRRGKTFYGLDLSVVCLNGQDAAGIFFWGDKYDQEKANRNFRNALYRIRKDFGKEFLISDGRQKVRIHPQADMYVDILDMKQDLEVLFSRKRAEFP